MILEKKTEIFDNSPKKFIDFIITKACTYNCQYCSQSKAFDNVKKNASKTTINNFLNFLDKIENDFEITITGGEAILHPDFYYLINEIKKRDFKINLITNLSFPYDVYQGIFNILGKNLNRYDVSAHIGQIENFDFFLDKLEKFISSKPKACEMTLFIPVFKLNTEKEEKIQKLINLAQLNSLDYQFQQVRFLDNFSYLNDEEKKYLPSHEVQESFGKYCYSGFLSCVIYEDGSAYRCWGSRFKKSNYLGNINDYDFKLRTKKCVCSKKYCMCDKPLKYAQLTQEMSKSLAFAACLKDIIYLPVLMFKNRNIIKTKLKQYESLKKFFTPSH